MNKKTKESLEAEVKKLRKDILLMLYESQSGHPGGSLSAIDFVAYLFLKVMKYDPSNPAWEERDRFILSKGHAAPALYAVLAHVGYYSPKLLKTLRKLGSPLQGHPDSRKLPGVESSTGSLGQGISIAGGMALAGKMDQKDHNVYCLVGDGELQEGQIWEAAMSIAHFKLDHFCLFVDNNNLQIDGAIQNVMNPHPITDKFKAFGWEVMGIDGNNLEDIEKGIEFFKTNRSSGKPTVIVGDTVKGKCVSFMENKKEWHGVAPNREQLEQALEEIGCVESLEDWLTEDSKWGK